jgi:uncharacterized membrane protein
MFILYGGVMLVLGFLDRKYERTFEYVIFLVLGIALITLCLGYRDGKPWGWYGLVGVFGLTVLGTLFGLGDYLNVVLLLLTAVALGALFHPEAKVR